jgi:hypothetical protein
LGEHLHRYRAYRLKDRPRYIADDKTDDGFHKTRYEAASYQKRGFFSRVCTGIRPYSFLLGLGLGANYSSLLCGDADLKARN